MQEPKWFINRAAHLVRRPSQPSRLSAGHCVPQASRKVPSALQSLISIKIWSLWCCVAFLAEPLRLQSLPTPATLKAPSSSDISDIYDRSLAEAQLDLSILGLFWDFSCIMVTAFSAFLGSARHKSEEKFSLIPTVMLYSCGHLFGPSLFTVFPSHNQLTRFFKLAYILHIYTVHMIHKKGCCVESLTNNLKYRRSLPGLPGFLGSYRQASMEKTWISSDLNDNSHFRECGSCQARVSWHPRGM